jgi:hypothetical protein
MTHDSAERALKEAATGWAVAARAHKSLDQPHHSTPFHPIESVNDLVLVEQGQQALHGLCCISRSRLDVLPQDTPSVLDGAQKGVLVGGGSGCSSKLKTA